MQQLRLSVLLRLLPRPQHCSLRQHKHNVQERYPPFIVPYLRMACVSSTASESDFADPSGSAPLGPASSSPSGGGRKTARPSSAATLWPKGSSLSGGVSSSVGTQESG